MNFVIFAGCLNGLYILGRYSDNFPELQGNSKEIKKNILEQIPIKQISKEEEKPFIEKVNKILKLKLYELTVEEIKIVENSVE